MPPKEIIKDIILNGTSEDKKALFSFNKQTSNEKILKKFKLFAYSQYPRYFPSKEAPFHDRMMMRTIKSYRGANVGDIAYRGSAKTTLKKLLRCYLILNDEDHYRKYIKILSRDGDNSSQIVTDIYNLCLEVASIYGDVFQKQGEKKTEETMTSFTMASGVKVKAGTVGKKQRGHLQDAYRPDWIWFEDIEDVESVSSQVVTAGVIKRCDEAITGLSKNGSWEITANYISDTGSVQWFLDKKNIEKEIIPVAENVRILNGKIVEATPTWDIYSIADIQVFKDDALDFWGDYMCDPNRSENKFFDVERIERDMLSCREPVYTSGLTKYWAGYQPHHRYGQGSDHSEGIGEDANTLVGYDFNTGEVVYTYANNEIAPDLAAHEFAKIGANFGNCVWGPEVNNKCGGTVLTTAVNIPYLNLYHQKVIKDGVEVDGTKLGWDTNSKTKNTMFFDFKRDYNDGLIKIYDKELLKEMKAYTNNDLKERTTGLITRHFDLLTSAVIGWQMKGEIPQKKTASVQYHGY